MSEDQKQDPRAEKAWDEIVAEDMVLLWPEIRPAGTALAEWRRAVDKIRESDPALSLEPKGAAAEALAERTLAAVMDAVEEIDQAANGARRGRGGALSAASMAALVGSIAWAGLERYANRPFDSVQERQSLEEFIKKQS